MRNVKPVPRRASGSQDGMPLYPPLYKTHNPTRGLLKAPRLHRTACIANPHYRSRFYCLSSNAQYHPLCTYRFSPAFLHIPCRHARNPLSVYAPTKAVCSSFRQAQLFSPRPRQPQYALRQYPSLFLQGTYLCRYLPSRLCLWFLKRHAPYAL